MIQRAPNATTRTATATRDAGALDLFLAKEGDYVVVVGNTSIVWSESPDQVLSFQTAPYVSRTTTLNGTPLAGLSPGDVHRQVRVTQQLGDSITGALLEIGSQLVNDQLRRLQCEEFDLGRHDVQLPERTLRFPSRSVRVIRQGPGPSR
jgi:hypothetical protein